MSDEKNFDAKKFSDDLHDQIHRIERQLRVRSITEIDDNIIVTCAPLIPGFTESAQ